MWKGIASIIICFSLIFILLLAPVSAGWFADFWKKTTGQVIFGDSVSDVLDEMVISTSSYEDISIVYGDDAAIEDFFGAFMVSDILPIFDDDKGRSPYVRKASEIMSTTYQNKNLILIGGPCANLISEVITDEEGYNCEDWKFDSGMAIVKVFDNGEGKVIMISGTTKGDTWRISDAIRRYDKSVKLSSSDEVIFDTPAGGECGNNICETRETDQNCPEDCSNEGSVQLTSDLVVKTLDIDNDKIAFYAWGSSEPYVIDAEAGIMSEGGGVGSGVYLYDLTSNTNLKISDKGSWPQIDGDYVVYTDMGEVLNENTGDYVERLVISLYKISTEETISLTEAKIGYFYEWPMIYGNNVVWLETIELYEDTSSPKLMIYNIETKSTNKLVDMRHFWDSNFKIYGDKIVYQGPKYCIPEDCSQVKTEISPRNFLYENAEEGDQDIWLYDMVTNEKTRITSDEEYQGMPDIWGDFLVWVDDRSIAEGNKGIYMYNILTGEENPINLTYAVPGGHTAISFSDYNVIWTDYRNENGDVYFYNIQGNTERRITLNSESQGGGKLDGNYVVWIDHRNGGQDLYMLELA